MGNKNGGVGARSGVAALNRERRELAQDARGNRDKELEGAVLGRSAGDVNEVEREVGVKTSNEILKPVNGRIMATESEVAVARAKYGERFGRTDYKDAAGLLSVWGNAEAAFQVRAGSPDRVIFGGGKSTPAIRAKHAAAVRSGSKVYYRESVRRVNEVTSSRVAWRRYRASEENNAHQSARLYRHKAALLLAAGE